MYVAHRTTAAAEPTRRHRPPSLCVNCRTEAEVVHRVHGETRQMSHTVLIITVCRVVVVRRQHIADLVGTSPRGWRRAAAADHWALRRAELDRSDARGNRQRTAAGARAMTARHAALCRAMDAAVPSRYSSHRRFAERSTRATKAAAFPAAPTRRWVISSRSIRSPPARTQGRLRGHAQPAASGAGTQFAHWQYRCTSTQQHRAGHRRFRSNVRLEVERRGCLLQPDPHGVLPRWHDRQKYPH